MNLEDFQFHIGLQKYGEGASRCTWQRIAHEMIGLLEHLGWRGDLLTQSPSTDFHSWITVTLSSRVCRGESSSFCPAQVSVPDSDPVFPFLHEDVGPPIQRDLGTALLLPFSSACYLWKLSESYCHVTSLWLHSTCQKLTVLMIHARSLISWHPVHSAVQAALFYS